jgi:thiamine biosynthesis lipoprotein
MAVTEHRFRVMASDVHIVIVDAPASAIVEARLLLERLERCWSRFLPDSDISRINRAPGRPIEVDPYTLTLVATMIEASRATGGRYDPTVLPVLVADGYRSSIACPSNVTLLPSSATHSGDLTGIVTDRARRTVTTPVGTALDAGGIGKGLAADLAVTLLLTVGAAGALVAIGGDLSCAGTAPHPDGWPVTVEHPDEPSVDIVTFTIAAGGVATSSTRSRRWDQRGVPRHHVIDPATGAMSTTDIAAVTVVAASGWLAEAHATAAILAGTAGVREHLRTHELSGLAVAADGTVLATPDLALDVPAARR